MLQDQPFSAYEWLLWDEQGEYQQLLEKRRQLLVKLADNQVRLRRFERRARVRKHRDRS